MPESQEPHSVITQILTHTPLWVFGLFFGLVYLGYLQSRTRLVSRHRLIVLPVAMTGWSLFAVWSAFGAHPIALVAWAGAWLAVVGISLARGPSRGASYSPVSKRFMVTGSWLPLALMMGIFFAKYAVAVVHAIAPSVLEFGTAIATVCGVYGFFSGMFMARAVRVLRTMMSSPDDEQGETVAARV
ncbi:DUF6622 family protein [Pseudoxanthomonas sp. LjRoot143]|uniref:DUF6622 family protein n=1 Tax=Pseudoxanthomonas sp. LjRoot143 TaxID=3342266 RepID=UPI003F4F3F4F